MRNIRLDMEYDGTAYHGWQIQKNARSICGELEKAIEQVVQHPVKVLGSGRTDAGVHALGQVATVRIDKDIPEENLMRAINSLTPRDIMVHRAVEVPEEFDARRDAIERYYRYQCYTGRVPSALMRRMTLFLRRRPDVEAMRRAASALEGTHDFTAFRSAQCDADNPVRQLRSLKVIEEKPFLFFDVRANAFLRNMVRILGSTLLEAGYGRLDPHEIPAIIESRDRRRAGPTLPPHGLILMKVTYPGEEDSPNPPGAVGYSSLREVSS